MKNQAKKNGKRIRRRRVLPPMKKNMKRTPKLRECRKTWTEFTVIPSPKLLTNHCQKPWKFIAPFSAICPAAGHRPWPTTRSRKPMSRIAPHGPGCRFSLPPGGGGGGGGGAFHGEGWREEKNAYQQHRALLVSRAVSHFLLTK